MHFCTCHPDRLLFTELKLFKSINYKNCLPLLHKYMSFLQNFGKIILNVDILEAQLHHTIKIIAVVVQGTKN